MNWGIRAPLLTVMLCLACGGAEEQGGRDQALSAGAATVFDRTRLSYEQPLPALSGERREAFLLGNAVFDRGWITAPAAATQVDGLGPLFNAASCAACHLNSGRGRPPKEPGEMMLSMIVRLSVPGMHEHGGPLPEPSYGTQLQDRAIAGVSPEAQVTVRYEELPGAFADGEAFSLRKPVYIVEQLGYGPLSPDVLMSPRVAPAVFGLGLLAAIPEATLYSLADPDDRDGDGISGRINHVWDVQAGAPAVGRFGWKASQPNLAQQTAAAFLGDMGLSTELFPTQECTSAQRACSAAPVGALDGEPEVEPTDFASLIHFMHTLAVPARRDYARPAVAQGERIFHELGCARCHLPSLQTGALPGFPELEGHTIRPYTDLLLHDMGEGLSDLRPDYEASGQEWRTPPLWGIGLVKTVNSHAYFLHDGRARGLLEAVLWHGGEAQAARDGVLALSKQERAALVAFLESL